MTNLQIKKGSKSYLNEETEKLIDALNQDSKFILELEKVFKIMYHRYYNDESTPELNDLIQSKTSNDRISYFINETFRDWMTENIQPLHIETLENTFVKNVMFPNLNKCHKFLEYYLQLVQADYQMNEVKINKVVTLYNHDFEKFIDSFLDGREFLTEGGTGTHMEVDPKYLDENGYFNNEFYKNDSLVKEAKRQSYRETQLIQDLKGNCVIIDTQGYNYSRYVGFMASDNAFKKPSIKTPKTDDFINARLEAKRRRQAEIDEAYQRAYYN